MLKARLCLGWLSWDLRKKRSFALRLRKDESSKRACPAVIWVLIAPLGTGSLRGAQTCPRVVWGISWGAARLLLSLRPGRVCLKHTPVLGSDSRTELLLWLLWPPCGQWAVREQPGTLQHSTARAAPAALTPHKCCSLLSLHSPAAPSVSR